MDQAPVLGPHTFCEIAKNMPFGSALADSATGDLWREVDPSLGGGLRPAAFLLVSGPSRKEKHDVRGIDEHGRRDDEILVNAKGDPTQGLCDISWLRKGLEEVSACRVQHVDAARMRRVDHPDRC